MPSSNKKKGTSRKSTIKTESTTDVAPTDRLANPLPTAEMKPTTKHIGSGMETTDEGNKHTMVIKVPPRDPDGAIAEAKAIEREAYFDQFGSQLIIEGWSALQPILSEMKKKIKEFNVKCAEEEVNFFLRWGHQSKYRSRTYLYCGSYIYEKKDGKEVYVSKYTARDWRITIGEDKFAKVGTPPKLDIDNVRFRRVTSYDKDNKKEIQYNSLIMPNSEFYRYRRYFGTLPAYQLG
ncbi:MAG: hypothetical protein ACXAC2_00210 [Candidatus Kariarchaeaceae archaeon]|jgi:hypothetical protein